MPLTIFEGTRETDMSELNRRNMERRFYALAAAVKEHEARTMRARQPVRPEDEILYRRLRQLSGEPVTAEHGAA